MNFKKPYPTSIKEIKLLELTLESPSPVHGIPYKDLDLRGWIYWSGDWEAWVYVAEMDSAIGITCQYLHGKTFNHTSYDCCVRNPDRPKKVGASFTKAYIMAVHVILNGVWERGSGYTGKPTEKTCAFS